MEFGKEKIQLLLKKKCGILLHDMRRVPTLICSILTISVIISMFFAGCGGSGKTGEGPLPEARWTFMVFMAGDSDISQAAFRNINDMEDIGSTSQVNIVVQAEFSPEFSPSLPGNTLRGRITRDNDDKTIGSTLYDMGNLDMTDPGTLADFIFWAKTRFPAEHYAIVLWSHGLGWKGSVKGMIQDVTSAGDNYIMPLPDIADALQAGGVKFDTIDFDSCLMGMYEVAYELKGLSDFITFSEALFPIFGNPYTMILSELTSRPEINGEGLAHIMISACEDYYDDLGYSFTKSAVRASQIEKVHICVNDLAEVLINSMSGEGEHIRTAVGNTEEYYSYIYRDLGDFLEQLRMQTTDQVLLAAIASLEGALEDLVMENLSRSSDMEDPIARAHGLAIYLPAPGLNISRDLLRYSTLSCNRGDHITWVDFISQMSAEL